MAYTFDGVSKIISFDTSTIAFDVRDLWSRWNDWLSESDNSKYDLAMRVVGGDPLVGGKELGLTYFLMNGWKIRPYEESHTLSVNGNLYSEDGSSPFAPVIGSYNVMIINTVSNLVDSTVQQLPEIEQSSFNGVVAIDVDNGVSGTLYPKGTIGTPVNNLADAKSIASARNLTTLLLLSNFTITNGDNVDNLTIKSNNWLDVTVEAGASVENTVFEKVGLYGVMGGYWNVLVDCWVYNITNFCGWLRGGSFSEIVLAPYTEDSAGQSFFDEIVPMYPTVPSVLIMNTDTFVSFTRSTDTYEIKNMTEGSILSMGLSGGICIIDSSCTGGEIIVAGTGTLVNNSTLEINTDGLVSADYVAEHVWDELLTEHTENGTAGKALGTASTGGVDYDALSLAVWSSASRTLTESTSASQIALEVWEQELETNYSAKEILRLLSSILAGITVGSDTSEISFRDLNNIKNRVIATIDSNGNRTEVVKNVS